MERINLTEKRDILTSLNDAIHKFFIDINLYCIMILEKLICAEAQDIHNIFREFESIKIHLRLQNYNSILQSGLTRQNIIIHFYIWF